MIATEPIYIPLNKGKLAGLLRLSIYFFIGGLFLVSTLRLNHSLFATIISCIGIVQILFSAWLAISLFQKRRDKKAGITIDDTGITDNTILFSACYIPWSEIQEIKRTKDKLLIILVNNPSAYISRQSNFVKRIIMKSLLKTYGSPIIIASNELKSDFDKLQNILQTELKENKLG
jgi:hypothetical protein